MKRWITVQAHVWVWPQGGPEVQGSIVSKLEAAGWEVRRIAIDSDALRSVIPQWGAIDAELRQEGGTKGGAKVALRDAVAQTSNLGNTLKNAVAVWSEQVIEPTIEDVAPAFGFAAVLVVAVVAFFLLK